MSWPICGARRAELRLGDADLRISGVAGRLLGIDLGLGDEAAALERDGALVIGLGKRGIGARRLDLRGELRRLLRLDRAVDDREHLARADPAAGIDEDADDAAALSRRCRPAGRAWRASGPLAVIIARDLAAAGNDDRDRRDLARALAAGRRGRLAAPRPIIIADAQDDEQRRAATAAPMITQRRRRARSVTTSVSEEWIEVSRFIIPLPSLRISRLSVASCITRISHLAQQTRCAPLTSPLLFD